jgi:Tfp pilus assembly protein PilX
VKTIMTRKCQGGMALVTVLIFLSISSLIALTLVEQSILTSKMSMYYAQKIKAFYQTEAILAQYESDLLAGKPVKSAHKIMSDGSVDYYSVLAAANYHGAKVRLQSTVAKIIKPPVKVKAGRQSWRTATEK